MSDKNNLSPKFNLFLEQKGIEQLGERITLAEKSLEEWHYTVIRILGEALIYEALSLKDQSEKVHFLNEVSWHGRNLLELSVWIQYCTHSVENAKRFYDDVGRNHKNMIEKTDEWAKENDTQNYSPELKKNSITILNEEAKHHSLNLDGKYLDVGKIAKEINYTDFSIINKTFSKFVHVTSYSLLANDNRTIMETLFPIHYNLACISFFQGYERLVNYFDSIAKAKN